MCFVSIDSEQLNHFAVQIHSVVFGLHRTEPKSSFMNVQNWITPKKVLITIYGATSFCHLRLLEASNNEILML